MLRDKFSKGAPHGRESTRDLIRVLQGQNHASQFGCETQMEGPEVPLFESQQESDVPLSRTVDRSAEAGEAVWYSLPSLMAFSTKPWQLTR